MAKLLIINGPNLNMLGTREPDIYGHETLLDIENSCITKASSFGHNLEFIQSNSESDLINKIQQSRGLVDYIVINPAAFTHTSVAIRDALSAIEVPFIEVHLSNVFAREAFRHHSYFSDLAQGVICGLGSQGYLFAIEAAHKFLSE
ncbi:MAG: type II 3-dehydroquinate dehydratase [Saccharospirillaceae bacterium]|nr:type II 3-dehydroquinate dehydratase [Pseudomonadales bacterium]NRB79045.1 type II 3-dehydroquinate dehydratase [Saccharospirillaceae bacterium]